MKAIRIHICSIKSSLSLELNIIMLLISVGFIMALRLRCFNFVGIIVHDKFFE